MAPIDARKKLEQIRRNKNKNASNNKPVKDLRQLISKKKKPNSNDRSPNFGRVTRSGVRDLRDTNRKLATRKTFTSKDGRPLGRADRSVQGSSRVVGGSNYAISTRRPNNLANNVKAVKQIQYYVPPHMQHQTPTYIIAPPNPQSNLAMDNVPEASGASILVSNLMPSITQSEIIELFSDIGAMTAVNMINQTTALVTYQNSSEAFRAVKVYHNRLLDGKPMQVNIMPNSIPVSNVRSRIG